MSDEKTVDCPYNDPNCSCLEPDHPDPVQGVARLRENIREIQRRYERREPLHTSDFTAAITSALVRTDHPDPVQEGQTYSRWFTDYPPTHERAGQTVEVMPVEEASRLGYVQLDEEERRCLDIELPLEPWATGPAHRKLYQALRAKLAPQ